MSFEILPDDRNIIVHEMISIAITALAEGILAILTSMAVYTLLRRGIRGARPRQCLLTTVIIILLSTTMIFFLTLAFYFTNYPLSSHDLLGSNYPPVSDFVLSEPTGLVLITNSCARLNYFLSDIIVMWRGWVLLESRGARIALVVWLFLTFGFTLYSASFGGHKFVGSTIGDAYSDLVTTGWGSWFMLIPLIVTNIVATIIVAYKTWIYRTKIKVHFDYQDGRRKIEKILMLLLESGLIYCAIWIIYFALQVHEMVFEGSAVNDISNIMPFISAVYPVTVILLVEYGKTDDVNPAGDRVVSRSIRFASTPELRGAVSNSAYSNSIIQTIADHIQSAHKAQGEENVNTNGTDGENMPRSDGLENKDEASKEEQRADASIPQ